MTAKEIRRGRGGRRGRRLAVLTAVCTAMGVVLAMPLASQSIADQVAAVRDGQVRMSFTAREGVCGNGRNITTHRDDDDWESWCEPGPVRVAIDIRDREIVDIDTYVGGRWRARNNVTDLQMVPAPAAADYFMSLAQTERGKVSKDAIFPATLADSAVVWPELLVIAKNTDRPRETRKSAVFWLGQAAGEAATEGLGEIVYDESGDGEVRESAIFALSQLDDDAGVPILIDIVRNHRDPNLKKKAIFWLGQSEDPRVVALFEELLVKP
ncbi:MAG: HEAT repeat domain-containing protein [Gemmatimonadota bacterium]|nr:MAG: HEAT repeat domain-containing protein [Gemmatimonadota bacterium]